MAEPKKNDKPSTAPSGFNADNTRQHKLMALGIEPKVASGKKLPA